MASTLNLYKGESLLDTKEAVEGKAKVTITDLEPNTEYSEGTFQVTWQNENGESDRVNVPSFKTDSVGVTNITVENDSITIKVGETSDINAQVEPDNATDKSLSFTSDSDNIATVDDSGSVLGVEAGTATITISSSDNSVEKQVTVTVEEDVPEEPSDVSVDTGEDSADVSVEQ